MKKVEIEIPEEVLDLLQKLYGKVIVPETVAKELEQGRAEGEDVPNLANYPWIEIRNVHIPKTLKMAAELGPGEAGVLT